MKKIIFKANIKSIAFYLPQFHPIPENDEWWGKGFTEWTNVTRAKPLFKGHYQPHLPADLGFYDLRLPEVRQEQAELARAYGIYGFCYYHYWFNGKKMLERPFDDILKSGKPSFPFCLCWANENWTRVWDGGDQKVLIKQNYTAHDDIDHIENLIPVFQDDRYITINGKPIFLVYRTELLPDPIQTAKIWKKAVKKAGLPGLYLIRVESIKANINPVDIGFDAATEFAPDWRNRGPLLKQNLFYKMLSKFGLGPTTFIKNKISDYNTMVYLMLQKRLPKYTWFRCVTPSWDNTPRRQSGGAGIFINSSPAKYEHWLSEIIKQTKSRFTNDEGVVFINAWNEWAEGNHLEPDLKWGNSYLESTKRALNSCCTS